MQPIGRRRHVAAVVAGTLSLAVALAACGATATPPPGSPAPGGGAASGSPPTAVGGTAGAVTSPAPSSDGSGTAGLSPAPASAGAGGLPEAPPAAFYVPPRPLPVAPPGTLIRSLELRSPPTYRAWAILYHSRSVDGADVAVSGIVTAPRGASPDGGWPVVALAHGTTGIADGCAPSHEGADAVPPIVAAQGYAVAATDYEGLGTPGPHPYIVGVSEGRSVLDSVRAARQIPEAAAGDRVVVLGHSQGGHAALWAAELAASWAPELHVLGAAAGAPGGDLATTLRAAIPGGAARPFLMLVLAAWHDVYGAPFGDLLSAAGRRDVAILRSSESSATCPSYESLGRDDPFAADPLGAEPWSGLLADNTPGHTRTAVPLLLVQGTADPIIPLAATQALARRLCAVGDTVELKTYPGATHATVIAVAAPDYVAWVRARFDGEAPSSTCG